MHTKFVIFVVVSALLVASIYSISSSIVFALIKKGDLACVKKVENGITTETCCHTELDTQTGKKINYCTECKTLSDGTDMGCTHTQTDMTRTKVLQGVKPGITVQSTEQASNHTGVMNGGSILKNGGLLKGSTVFKGGATTENNNNSTNSNDTLQK
jgi:hypothetical protein